MSGHRTATGGEGACAAWLAQADAEAMEAVRRVLTVPTSAGGYLHSPREPISWEAFDKELERLAFALRFRHVARRAAEIEALFATTSIVAVDPFEDPEE